MSEAVRQLTLPWPTNERSGLDDFLVGDTNTRAFELIMRWPDWPERVLTLVGPASTGKSHLASIFARHAGAPLLTGAGLDAETVLGLDAARPVVIDSADEGLADEHALFHLLNRIRAERGSALLIGRRAAQHWNVATRDLLSRLRQAPTVEIAPPDDALFKAVLVKLFHDRQLVVDATVVDYLALRLDRSIAQARSVVATLDGQALSLGRRITRPMAAFVLGGLAPGETDEWDGEDDR